MKKAISIHRDDIEMNRRMGAHGEKPSDGPGSDVATRARTAVRDRPA
jgi:hypothetical protein